MAPAQPGTDISRDIKVMKIEPDEASDAILEISHGKDLLSTNRPEATLIGIEVSIHEEPLAAEYPESTEVDIIARSRIDDMRLVEKEDPEATEYSSSFGNTISDTDMCSSLSEGEVESQFFGDSDLGTLYGELTRLYKKRKKKLTDHWRNFIHPLKWRCKWAELKIKEFESQSLKYDKEVAVYKQRRHPEANQTTLESFASRSFPFSSKSYHKKAKKRRRRKKVEETTDIKSYMENHNLFFSVENRRTNLAEDIAATAATTAQLPGCNENFGFSNDELLLEFKNGDNSFANILWKVEMVHSRVQKLKNQLEYVMSKHAARFSSYENLSHLLTPCDGQASSAPSPTVSAGNKDTIHMSTNRTLEYEISELVLPQSAMSSYVEAVHVPDIVESTTRLLSADVKPQIGEACGSITNSALLRYEAVKVKEERHTFTSKTTLVKEEQRELPKIKEEKEGIAETSLTSTSECKPSMETLSFLKPCLVSDIAFPKNKRKRGERKASSGVWTMINCHGEPDNLQ